MVANLSYREIKFQQYLTGKCFSLHKLALGTILYFTKNTSYYDFKVSAPLQGTPR